MMENRVTSQDAAFSDIKSMTRRDIAFGKVSLAYDERREQLRCATALAELSILAQTRLADAKERPIELHIKDGVSGLLELDDPVGPLQREDGRPTRSPPGESLEAAR